MYTESPASQQQPSSISDESNAAVATMALPLNADFRTTNAPSFEFQEQVRLNEKGAMYQIAKRAMDLAGASLLLLITAPIFVFAAIAVKLFDFGPIFYVHTRVGKGGKLFQCVKFRSMVVDAEMKKAELAARNKHADQRTFKLETDPRITRIGWWLRKLSIDELPQLLNVLPGDMSLVGPRAPIPQEVKLYSSRDQMRLTVKPGLTCIWQVSGRSNLAFPEQLRMDLEYIEKRNLWLDTKLLVLTVPAVLTCKGAC